MNSIKARLSFLGMLLILTFPIHVVFAFETEIEAISKEIAAELKEKQLDTIAVSDFTDLQGNVTELGRYLAEKTSIVLATSADGFNVVDRTHLKTLLKEHKLSASGVIDPATARELGKIAGVKALVTGSLVPIGDQVDLTVKVLDTETANILLAKTKKLAKTEALIQLMERNVVSADSNPDLKENNQASSKEKRTKGSGGFEKERANLRIKLLKCKLKEDSIRCIFDATNTGKEDNFAPNLYKQSYIYDENLDQYNATVVAIGGAIAGDHYKKINTYLAPDETEKGFLDFSGFTSNPKKITLSIVFDGARKYVFNDVPIE